MSDPLQTAYQAGHAAYAAADGDHQTRLHAAFDTLLRALHNAGHVRQPAPAEPTDDEIRDTARWLAEQSRHPRFWPTDQGGRGYEPLLTSEADIDMAHAQASKQVGPADRQTVDAAKTLLLRHAGRRARPWDGA